MIELRALLSYRTVQLRYIKSYVQATFPLLIVDVGYAQSCISGVS
jgi:hypothetical protein